MLSMSFLKKLHFPPEVYPLVAAVGAGCGLAAYTIGWTSTNSTDVNFRKHEQPWDQIDPKTHRPHYPFLAGKQANERIEEYMGRHPETLNQRYKGVTDDAQEAYEVANMQ